MTITMKDVPSYPILVLKVGHSILCVHMLPAISLVLPFGQALRICFRNTANFQLQRFAFTICITKYISYISPFGCFTKRGRQKIIQVDIKNIIAKKNKSSHKLADRNTQNFNEGKKVPNDKRKQADR